jgi:hypothetical protein
MKNDETNPQPQQNQHTLPSSKTNLDSSANKPNPDFGQEKHMKPQQPLLVEGSMPNVFWK